MLINPCRGMAKETATLRGGPVNPLFAALSRAAWIMTDKNCLVAFRVCRTTVRRTNDH